MLEVHDIDVIFSDISMPGLDGMALGRVLARFASPPQLVFVTAHEQHAVDAFALAATDYVMKPVRGERLAEAVRRVVVKQDEAGMPAHAERGPALPSPSRPVEHDETIPVELAASTRSSPGRRSATPRRPVDYARLHTLEPANSCASRSPCSRRSGASTASSGSTAPPLSRSRTSPRSGWTTGGARSSSVTSSSR